MLPLDLAQEGPHNRYCALDRVLCPAGGGLLIKIPRKDGAVHGRPSHHSQGKQGAAWV